MSAAAGVLPSPPQTVDDVRAAMRDAIAHDEPLCIRGAGSWRRAGAPVVETRVLSLAGLSGVIAYVPGDLTITVWAGTSLAELSQVTAAHGQWLGLDPAGDRTGTIGATIATASSGPLAHAFGTPRDLVLGLDAVTGYGDIVKPGGRVVKNVAGFDLVRLFTGSWGTLGAITSATLRLRALPVHDVTLSISVEESTLLAPVLTALRANSVSLLACEWIDGGTARAHGISDGADTVLLRLGGNDAFVRGQQAVLQRIAPCHACDPVIWSAIAALDRDAVAVVRVSGAVSTLPARIARVRAAVQGADRVALHASASRGVVRVCVAGDAERFRTALQQESPDETRIAEQLPAQWWPAETDHFGAGLSGRIRAAFDPQHLCNRRLAHA
jgi:glycolate oxidase FAD binding subunit